MKKKIIVLGLVTVLSISLSACDKTKEVDESQTKTTKTMEIESTKKGNNAKHPLYEDFEVVISEEPVDIYGKFDVTNNSDYSIEYFKLNYINEDGREYLLHTSTSMLPGETIKGNQFMLNEDQLENYKDYKPKWCEVKYLDEDKESHVWRYDIKLEKYDKYS